jgi:hypothetical protein
VVFGLALSLGLGMVTWADDGFIGQWTIKQEFQGRERVSTLTIGENSGTWESRRGTSELSKVKIMDGKLTFSRTFKREGREFSIDCEATIVNGNLVGKMVTSRGDREFTATLVTATPSFIGQWDIEMSFGERHFQAKLDITEVDGGLVGNWSSQRGDAQLDNVAIKDNTLTFSRTMERQGQEFTIDYKATLVDGKLEGQMATPRGETPFTGTAVAQQDEKAERARRNAELRRKADEIRRGW